MGGRRPVTARQLAAVRAHVAAGTHKGAAGSLGISESSVRELLRRARTNVGVATTMQAVYVLAASGQLEVPEVGVGHTGLTIFGRIPGGLNRPEMVSIHPFGSRGQRAAFSQRPWRFLISCPNSTADDMVLLVINTPTSNKCLWLGPGRYQPACRV